MSIILCFVVFTLCLLISWSNQKKKHTTKDETKKNTKLKSWIKFEKIKCALSICPSKIVRTLFGYINLISTQTMGINRTKAFRDTLWLPFSIILCSLMMKFFFSYLWLINSTKTKSNKICPQRLEKEIRLETDETNFGGSGHQSLCNLHQATDLELCCVCEVIVIYWFKMLLLQTIMESRR